MQQDHQQYVKNLQQQFRQKLTDQSRYIDEFKLEINKAL